MSMTPTDRATHYTCGACGAPVQHDATTAQFVRTCAHAGVGIVAHCAATARGASTVAGG